MAKLFAILIAALPATGFVFAPDARYRCRIVNRTGFMVKTEESAVE